MFPASILQFHPCVCILCDRYSMCTLRYTDVAYFAGINDNYQLVNRDEVTDFRSFVLPVYSQPDFHMNEAEERKESDDQKDVSITRNLSYSRLRCRSPVREEIDQ